MSDLKLDLSADTESSIAALFQPSVSSTMTSYQPSPETTTMSLFGSQHVDDSVTNATDSWVQTIQKHGMSQSGQTSPTQMTQHQRTQSITDTDFDECVVSTGVTADDIAAFIQGPFPDDSKWRCLYKERDGEECGKRFARKENAKSHVQTHLGDRQYACTVCRTRFVRQHDLKRHFKIHTTEKPHRCPCGKDFHRHDALTRHRQRGMCIGAFENSPKKSVKRGRPKKARPSSEERAEKAAQTRQRIIEKTYPGSTYASSISGSSDDSHDSPPSFDNFSNPASSPPLSHKGLDSITFSYPSYQPLTPPTSPTRGSDKSYSTPYSQESYTPKPASRSPSPKITSMPEETQHFSMESIESGNDCYQSSPPELELSSSSPATSNLNFACISSEASHPSLPLDQAMDCLNPQILDGDFQLYGGSSKESPASELDTFFDFGEFQSSATEQKRQPNDPLLGREFFGNSFMNEPEDPFVDF
ncbi:uncharacterized protein KY384_005928 [Bacidia gigantensis]|uniref:uncharacterized protein n=1 Tax=Bacidia gigantensis TaxID=2732470 RepID=UPI001D046471|nr:uncharacterized protein KY384_005928 [Bacidia gigantensis]KAG8529293.1 hypothetical protein KY384_005928 [Bacidia gigantensis]